jgi:ABC-type antimicrobial peptide transport system permease subunit
MIVREGMRLAGLGAAAGLALVFVVTPLLQGLLYEVHPLDPALVTATLLLLGAAVVASYLPARTAGRMNPLAALRDP